MVPEKKVPGIKILCLSVLRKNLQKWGDAIPIKETGPQRDVTAPVNTEVIIITEYLKDLRFNPMLDA
jgi:hypothetical protein